MNWRRRTLADLMDRPKVTADDYDVVIVPNGRYKSGTISPRSGRWLCIYAKKRGGARITDRVVIPSGTDQVLFAGLTFLDGVTGDMPTHDQAFWYCDFRAKA